jgi:hypothetical protein
MKNTLLLALSLSPALSLAAETDGRYVQQINDVISVECKSVMGHDETPVVETLKVNRDRQDAVRSLLVRYTDPRTGKSKKLYLTSALVAWKKAGPELVSGKGTVTSIGISIQHTDPTNGSAIPVSNDFEESILTINRKPQSFQKLVCQVLHVG